ncbi:MAG: mannose-1-phosphate guanylyltransferase/mannose-6-phosphate isomerase [Deltaproteobacteria bacterium]|nr:mannose-1-phosphate guanylyltransferase/mannose-6-phosphate isomerase [Deltaproteobacteria bacterium]
MKIQPVILSGGAGTRLWPISRGLYPKQFQAFSTEKTLFQETILRLAKNDWAAPPLVICNIDQRFFVADQLHSLGILPEAIVLEPVGRNTAPAAAVAALMSECPTETILAIMPADHHITNGLEFCLAAYQAAMLAQNGWLMALGVHPTSPHTGYGYIETEHYLDENPSAYAIKSFHEKPDAITAAGYLANSRFLWNSGIFFFRADKYIEELERLQPDILTACRAAVSEARRDLDFIRLEAKNFSTSPSISIDYAVMEHTSKAAVLPVDIGWNDIGSWQALWQIGDKNAHGNVIKGDIVTHDVKNSYIRAEHGLVAAIGLNRMLVVETADAVLVAPLDRSEDVKYVVNIMRQNGNTQEQSHVRHYRPWGYFETLDSGDRFQVKRLMLKPGGKLSLQRHHHRAEHWVVVNGTAMATIGEKEMLLAPNDSLHIPLGTNHRLENPGKVPLHLIEVQSGDYLGEDDIVRIEDVYRRLDED